MLCLLVLCVLQACVGVKIDGKFLQHWRAQRRKLARAAGPQGRALLWIFIELADGGQGSGRHRGACTQPWAAPASAVERGSKASVVRTCISMDSAPVTPLSRNNMSTSTAQTEIMFCVAVHAACAHMPGILDKLLSCCRFHGEVRKVCI